MTSGNFLEMFDFFLFGLFAKPIGDAFFPAGDPVTRLLLAFTVFGAGFLMRPLGAIVLGAYLDRAGRRKGLILTLSIMAAGTAAVALTPTYRQLQAISPALAYAAPLLVLAGRLAQGFSAGVELGGVSVYLAEVAPPGRRGFFTSWQSASQQVAVMAGALIAFALERGLAPEQVRAYGWRWPFLGGCLIIPLIFAVRRQLPETPAFATRRHRPSGAEVWQSLINSAGVVALGLGLVAMTTVMFYFITIYTPTFGRQVLRVDSARTLAVTFAVGLSNFCWLPVIGALSDWLGRKPLLVAFAASALLVAAPALAWLAAAPSFGRLLAVELALSFLYAGYNGAMVAALTELVPANVRTTGFALAYSLATALFGGFTPAVSELLISATGSRAAPGLWMGAAAALSLAAALAIPAEASSRRENDPTA